MSKEPLKKNISSMQVIKTLQVLLQGNYSMSELVERLNMNEPKPVFNNSVISKYINTCRYCGIDIPKIHNKYFVANLPFGMDLSLEETDLLENLQFIIRESFTSKQNKIFDAFLEKINKFSNKKIARVEKNSYAMISEMFERAIEDKRKINLMFKNRQEMICIPLQIVENKGKTFFNVSYKEKDRMIASDRVSGLVVTNDKFVPGFNEPCVIYTLKGDLAKRYAIRENEQLVYSPDGVATIYNKGEAKEILFSRLMRYDKDCEIMNPKSYREEFKQLIEDTLSNYGV